MTQLIIAHVAADAAYTDSLRAFLADLRPSMLPVRAASQPFMVGARVLLALVWTRNAEEAGVGPAFASFARVNPGRTLVLRAPDAQLSPDLVALRLPMTNLGREESDVREQVGAALQSAREAERPFTTDVYGPSMRPARAPSAPCAEAARQHVAPRTSGEGFAGGVVRGLAGSIALIGLGGGMTMGLSEPGEAQGLRLPDGTRPHRGYDADGAGRLQVGAANDPDGLYMPFYGAAGDEQRLLGDEEMLEQASALSEIARAERDLIEERLAQAIAELDTARKDSAPMMARLESLAGGSEPGAFVVAEATPAAAPVEAAPNKDDQALIKYAASIVGKPAASAQLSKRASIEVDPDLG